MSVLVDPANQEKLAAAADLLKRLSHPSRLLILARLAEGDAAVAELESGLGLRQPGLSQQLAELRNAGLIEPRRNARGVVYRLADERTAEIVSVVCAMFLGATPAKREARSAPASPRSPIPQLFGGAVFAKVAARPRVPSFENSEPSS